MESRPEVFADADLSEDGFLGGRLSIAQPLRGYRAAMDPVLLAAAVDARPGQSVLELGCGAGVASLCLAARVAGLSQSGIELQPDYAALARANARRNGLELAVTDGDVTAMPTSLRGLSFDHVITNPPYFPMDSGTSAANSGKETAQREAVTLDAWIAAGMRRLKPGGQFTAIQAAARLGDVLAALAGSAGDIAVLPVAPREGRPAQRVIVRARKGGRGALTLLAPLVLHDGPRHVADGDDHSAAARAILRDGAPLSLAVR